MLNHFIFSDGDNLVNLTTKKILPKDSTEEILAGNFFLKGQEKDCVDYFLFGRDKKSFSIDLIPTWECNLRCGHCFVLHELLKKDTRSVDQDMLVDFVRRLVDEYPSIQSGSIQFLGGEPTLRSKENAKLIDRISKEVKIEFQFRATSNGTICDDDALEFFSSLNSFIISMDGPKAIHNLQRKSIRGSDDPFSLTIKTIEKLISAGMRDKIVVQASLPEQYMTKENLVEFYKILLMSGVKFENIMAGFVCPTDHNPKVDEKFIEAYKSPRARPCCKYRHMSNFVVDNSNNIFCDYFEANGKNLIGRLSDPIEHIARNHERIIKESFSVLNDPKCQACPVIGMCWGWCANTKALNPSDHCDQALLIEKVKKNAERNNLARFIRSPRKCDATSCEDGTCKSRT